MGMTDEQWNLTAAYLRDVFGTPSDGHTAGVLKHQPTRAANAGLPPIAISADVGRLLSVFAMLATRSPTATGLILEVGTLGGYSGIWLARALPDSGRLITVEVDPKHAAFAANEFTLAGVDDRVEIVVGSAGDRLPELVDQLGPSSVDMIFLDADKREYPDYAAVLKPVLRIGGILAVDNALGSYRWWITHDPGALDDEARQSQAAADHFNRLMAADPDFETACVLNREGVLVAVRR
jgi:predicted O-methyltransferase YrrM